MAGMPFPALLVAAAVTATHVQIALAFTQHPAVSTDMARIATAEAAAIWSPYGVDVSLAGPCGRVPDETVVLSVVIGKPSVLATVSAGALGALTFSPEGTPGQVMTVFVDVLTRLLEAGSARRAETWPRVYRDRVVGRALGRVVAHEIGHFVLRSRRHTTSGLMQAVQRTDDLIDSARERFALVQPVGAR
jgi:hypothetical protein